MYNQLIIYDILNVVINIPSDVSSSVPPISSIPDPLSSVIQVDNLKSIVKNILNRYKYHIMLYLWMVVISMKRSVSSTALKVRIQELKKPVTLI